MAYESIAEELARETATRAPIKLHFKSGLTQPADAVQEEGPYYVVTTQGRSYTIKKDQIDKVEHVEPQPR